MGVGCSSASAVGYGDVADRRGYRLDCSERRLTERQTSAVVDAVRGNAKLQTLLLSYTQLGKQRRFLTSLMSVAEAHPSLHTLVLNGNAIREVAPIAAMLKANRSLTFLSLGGNRITTAGCTALLTALRSNTTLTVLALGGNQVAAGCADELLSCLEGNTTLEVLDLQGNPMHDSVLLDLERRFAPASSVAGAGAHATGPLAPAAGAGGAAGGEGGGLRAGAASLPRPDDADADGDPGPRGPLQVAMTAASEREREREPPCKRKREGEAPPPQQPATSLAALLTNLPPLPPTPVDESPSTQERKDFPGSGDGGDGHSPLGLDNDLALTFRSDPSDSPTRVVE